MSEDYLTRDYLIRMMRSGVERTGSQRAYAAELGISEQYLCDILNDRRDPGPTVLRALGLRAETVYLKDYGDQHAEPDL